MIQLPGQPHSITAPVLFLIDAFKKALFPDMCLVCGAFFHLQEYKQDGLRGWNNEKTDAVLNRQWHAHQFNRSPGIFFENLMRPFLCPACSETYSSVESPICSTCGVIFNSREGDDHVCGDCLKSPKKYRTARAAGIYDQSLMALIHRFKYNGKIQLARPLGALLFAAFVHSYGKDNVDFIVPVPLHSGKLRERGFNQSFLLVREWHIFADSQRINVPPFKIDRHSLVRSRRTESQAGLGREGRISNIKGAFSLRNSSKVNGRNILLVDDVYTTGATAGECADVLLSGGAKQVSVLTLARAM